MAGLTAQEAEARAAAVAVTSTSVELDLTGGADVFGARTTIRFRADAPETFVDVAPADLRRVVLDGVDLDPRLLAGRRFPLRGLGGEHELVVYALMRYSHDGEGLHRFVDPADGLVYLAATSALHAAPRWFACFDQPDLKTPLEYDVRCPADWTVVGNGPAEVVGPGLVRLAPTPPMPTYVATLVAGGYRSVSAAHDGIPLGLHARRSLAAQLDRDAPDLLSLTSDALDAFHDLFGVRYPFAEYHQAFVPEFNWGAMENPGCVTFRDQLLFRSRPSDGEVIERATTVVHEMAHMWFGDLVTMRWWDDLWLNESFAEYLGQRVTSAIRDVPAWELFAVGRKAWGYAADRRRSTHPVAGNGVRDADSALADFDGISYAKGAAVLRQLAGYLGDEMFLGGLRDHVRRHAFGNATFADLVDSWCAQARPGTPTAAQLRDWAEQWLRRAGVDILAVAPGPEGPVLRRGDPVVGPPAQRPHAVVLAGLDRDGSLLAAREVVVADRDVPAGVPGVVVPDAHDATWATVRLAPGDWRRLAGVMAGSRDTVLRAALWNALRTGVEDAVVPLADALDVFEAGLPAELDIVAARLLPWLGSTVPRHLPPGPGRDAATARLAALAGRLLAAAPPGASAQLTAARALVASTDDADLLRAWGAGRSLPPGIDVDEDLRWRLMLRRAVLGDATPGDIAAALALDPTSTAEDAAARATAALPDVGAKDDAWRAVLGEPSGLSQYRVVAMAQGVFVAGQERVWAPFVPRWFTDLPATSHVRSGHALSSVASACFPALAVDETVVAAARALADRADVAAGLRRVASDGADDLARAVAARAAEVAAGA